MQGMHIRHTITCLGATVTLQDISKIAARFFAVRWEVISSKSKSKVDFFIRWERHDGTAFLHRILLILLCVPCQSNFTVVRITKLCKVIRQFFSTNYPPFFQLFSPDYTTGLVGNAEEILRADSGVALAGIFSPVPVCYMEEQNRHR